MSMITEFTDRFIASREQVESRLRAGHPEDYKALVRLVVETVGTDDYGQPDPKRIHQIDDGDYQGTLVFVIGAGGYQPSDYWYVRVSYGSCSGCDTLEAVRGYRDEAPDDEAVKEYWTLCLHIAQNLRAMQGEVA
jgi:hypothetical protein